MRSTDGSGVGRDQRRVDWRDRRRRLFALAKAAASSVVRWPVWLLAGFVPKNPHLCVFGSWSGDRFADNAKWLFLYVTHEGRSGGMDFVWVSRSRAVVREVRSLDRPAMWLWSPGGLWCAIRASVFVFDADSRGIAFWASRSTQMVNLFHGIALKHIGADITRAGHPVSAAFHGPRWRQAMIRCLAPWFSESYDMVAASSHENALVMQSAFRLSEESVAITGLPRNDILRLTDTEVKSDFGIAPPPSPAPGKRIVLYVPTFRDFDRSGRTLPLDWDGIQAVMQRRNARFVLKLHPHDAARIPRLTSYPDLGLLEGDSDLYPLLRHTDVLITDYSSVFFDFLLRDKPIIFYAYDLEQYRHRDRDFYYSYEEVTPGYRVTDPAALTRRLDQILGGGVDPHKDDRQSLRRRFHLPESDRACPRLAECLTALER